MHQFSTSSEHETPPFCFLQQMLTIWMHCQTCRPTQYFCVTLISAFICIKLMHFKFNLVLKTFAIQKYFHVLETWRMKAANIWNAILRIFVSTTPRSCSSSSHLLHWHFYMARPYTVPNLKRNTAPPTHQFCLDTPTLASKLEEVVYYTLEMHSNVSLKTFFFFLISNFSETTKYVAVSEKPCSQLMRSLQIVQK